MQKTRFSAVAATFVYCFLFWMLLTWSIEPQELAAGAIVSLAAALFSAKFFIHNNAGWLFKPAKLLNLVAYIGVFFTELWKANTDMARRCYGGCKDVCPGIVKIPVGLKGDYAQAMLADSITLTPGTITMDVAEEDGQNYFYVHCIDVSGFEDKALSYVGFDGKEKVLASAKNKGSAGDAIKGRMEKWIRRIWE